MKMLCKADANEQDPDATDAPGWCSRNVKPIKCSLFVLVLVTIMCVVSFRYIIARYIKPESFPYEEMLSTLNLTSESSDESIKDAIDLMNEHFQTRSKCGSVVGVTRDKTRLIVSQGVTEFGTEKSMDEHTLFEIGSISKPFSGLVLADQIAAGNLGLDTPLNVFLPDSVPDLIIDNELVTFRQLVTHTAGFPREPRAVRDRYESDMFDHSAEFAHSGFSEEDMLREIRLAANDGLLQSGNVEYSNFGFYILAYLLGNCVNENESFPYLQQSITDQLHMNNTFVGTTLTDDALARLSTGHTRPGNQRAPYLYDGGLFIDGAGSTLSSATDMLTFVETLIQAFGNSNITTNETNRLDIALTLSLTPLKEIESGFGVAFGWFYGNASDPQTVYYAHSGGMPGFTTYTVFQPKNQIGVVALTNCGRTQDIVAMGYALASELFQNE